MKKILVIMLLLSLFACKKAAIEGAPAPDFTLATFDGEKIALGALKGSPVILYFFASW
jgi:peroxiredoxin